MKPFIKWAGGKRWILESEQLALPHFAGRYFEPFLGGAAVFFHVAPAKSVLSDVNSRLIDTYRAIKSDWRLVENELKRMQKLHSREFYYQERSRVRRTLHTRAAQFLYLNRTCWNGLYRENLSGKFNVPIGTKTQIVLPDDDFESVSKVLQSAKLSACDFEQTIGLAGDGDLVFLDPPYTEAVHTSAYNKSFEKEDHERLAKILKKTKFPFLATYDNTEYVRDLYSWAEQKSYTWKYSVQMSHKQSREEGKELFITNFKLNEKIQTKII